MEEVSERRYPTCTEYEMSWWATRVGKEERRGAPSTSPSVFACTLQWEEEEGRRERKSRIWRGGEGRGGKRDEM